MEILNDNDAEQKYPFVKFKTMKRFSNIKSPNGEELPSYWYLNVNGVHNQVGKITQYIKDGNVLVGHGNLKGKHSDIRNLIDTLTGKSVDKRLLQDAPVKALTEKVNNERQTRQVRE